MKLRKNDTVAVITGKDKGKTGKILKAFPARHAVVVEGVNIITKHVRARRGGEKGQKIFYPGKLDVSKVMLLCQKCGQKARVGYRIAPGESRREKKVRICKKCNQELTA